MNILSIDIGIKNLAFSICKIVKKKENLVIEIIDWTVINLIESNICQEIKSCKCNSKFFINKKDISNNIFQHFICNKHSQKYDKQILNKFKNENSNNISLINISNNIIKYLDKYFESLREKNNIKISDFSNIIIENQIGPLAIRMKSIQAMITMYFVYNENINIEYINSSNKLKYFVNKTSSYKERKKQSINITKSLLEDKVYKLNNLNNIEIENNHYWLNIFINNSKKDDLADCFLQLLYFALI